MDDAKMRRRIALGKILRDARHARELTLETVAKKAGVSVPFLSDLERGKRVVGTRRLYALVQALELPDAAFVRIFQLRQRLPPKDERWFLQHADLWPSQAKGSLPSG